MTENVAMRSVFEYQRQLDVADLATRGGSLLHGTFFRRQLAAIFQHAERLGRLDLDAGLRVLRVLEQSQGVQA